MRLRSAFSSLARQQMAFALQEDFIGLDDGIDSLANSLADDETDSFASEEEGEVHPSDEVVEMARSRYESRSPSTDGYSPELSDGGRPRKRRKIAVLSLNLSQTGAALMTW